MNYFDLNLSDLDIQVLNAIKNHKKVFSDGLSNLTNQRKFTVLRSISKLISLGYVVKQKGATIDDEHYVRARCYKLKNEKMWVQSCLLN